MANDDFFGTQMLANANANTSQQFPNVNYAAPQNRPPANAGNYTEADFKQWYKDYLGRDAEEGAHSDYISQHGYTETLRQAIINSEEARRYAASKPKDDGNGGSGDQAYATGGAVIPPDLFNLRGFLGDFLVQQLQRGNTPYTGQLDATYDPKLRKAEETYERGLEFSDTAFRDATADTASLRYLAENEDYTDITAALEGIREKSMLDLEDQLAGIREKYGAMGLGAGSDISRALGTGASRGIADMNAQQQALVAQVRENAKNRRLTAAQALPQTMTNIASGQNQAYNTAAQGYTQLGSIGQTIQEGNLKRQYEEFLRLQGPSPYLNPAIAYATGFPPVKPAIPEQDNGNSQAWIAALGTGLAAALPYIIGAFSDRNLKYDISEVKSEDVLNSLATLPISKWKYKGDTTTHIGPMAQDFQEKFGVGDGHTISLVDVMGVILASNKAIAEKHVGSGKTEAARGKN